MAKDNSTYLALNAIFQEVHDPKKYDKFEEYREKNQKESENKSDLKRRQNRDKTETKQRQNGDKIETESETNQRQNGDKIETKQIQNRDRIGDKTETKIETKQRQNEDKSETDFNVSELTKNQRKLMFYIFDECLQNGGKVTSPITATYISEMTNLSVSTAKKLIQRLESLEYLIRLKFKRGVSGWTIYELENSIYSKLLIAKEKFKDEDKTETKRRQNGDKIETESETESETSSPCSSSYNYNNEITTTTELPPDWQSIDFCKLNEKIYFGMNDLKNIYKAGKLTSAEFQKSIHGFAHRLENDEKFRNEIKNKKSYFMSTSLDGGSFHDPEKVEILKKQKEAEEMMARYQEQDRLRAIQDKHREDNFRVWCDGLNPQKKDEILAKLSPDENTFIHRRAALYTYYEDNELES